MGKGYLIAHLKEHDKEGMESLNKCLDQLLESTVEKF